MTDVTLPYTMREDLARMKAGYSWALYIWHHDDLMRMEKKWRPAERAGYITIVNDPKDQKRKVLTRTAKEIEVGEKPDYGYYFTPDHRHLLANWPANTSRLVEVFENNLNKKMWEEGAKEGYYVIVDEVDDTHLAITRTDKKMREYNPRKKDTRHQHGVNSLWPWRAEIHWERMRANPIRKARDVTRQLADHKTADLRLHVLYPTIITDLAMLKGVRDDLEKAFTIFPKGMVANTWVANRYLGHGVTTRLLFLDLMIEPEFVKATNDKGQEVVRFVKFVALDAEEVVREYAELGGGTTDNPVLKYVNFMRQRGKL